MFACTNQLGICTGSTAPSVSSINRILRNRAAERAAAEFTRNIHLGVSLQAMQFGNAANITQPNLESNSSISNPLINTPVLNHTLNQNANQNSNNILPPANNNSAFAQNNFNNLIGLMGNAAASPNTNSYTNGKFDMFIFKILLNFLFNKFSFLRKLKLLFYYF